MPLALGFHKGQFLNPLMLIDLEDIAGTRPTRDIQLDKSP